MGMGPERKRQVAMERYLAKEQAESIWQSLGQSRRWFFKWLARYREGEKEWYKEQSRRPRSSPCRSDKTVEAIVELVRRELQESGGFYGAQAIRWRLEEMGAQRLPSPRTIGRILVRHDLVCRRNGRYQPKGTAYLEPAARRPNDVHQADFAGPQFLRGGFRFYSLNSVDIATGRCGIEPVGGRDLVVPAFWALWLRLGIPKYQQVDNEMSFFGSPAHPRGMGKLIRLCLLNGVEPVFVPLGEPWRNGVVEKFNCFWGKKFIKRVEMCTEQQLRRESLAFEGRHNSSWRYSKLSGRTPLEALARSRAKLRFPATVEPPCEPLAKPKRGKYHVVRLIRSDGKLDMFGEKLAVPREALYEYVWATVDVRRQKLTLRVTGRVIDERPYRMR